MPIKSVLNPARAAANSSSRPPSSPVRPGGVVWFSSVETLRSPPKIPVLAARNDPRMIRVLFSRQYLMQLFSKIPDSHPINLIVSYDGCLKKKLYNSRNFWHCPCVLYPAPSEILPSLFPFLVSALVSLYNPFSTRTSKRAPLPGFPFLSYGDTGD